MNSFLKTETVFIDSMNTLLEIRELSAATQFAMNEAGPDAPPITIMCIVCTAGVAEWDGATQDELLSNLTMDHLGEITDRILALSGLEEGAVTKRKKKPRTRTAALPSN